MQRVRSFIQLWTLILLTASPVVYAHTRVCEQLLGSPKPVTVRTLRAFSQERLERNLLLARLPGFDNIEAEAANEQVGERGPLALQQMLGFDQSFLSTPAPTSPDVATVSLLDEASSFPVHVDTKWQGKRTSTAVYASLPQPVAAGQGKFLVGSTYQTAIVFLHGGGTPTATGKNAMTMGEKMAAQGIPVIAPDMPGHGRATRNPEGLLTFQQQADWLMQVIDQLVHPNVKIILAGHSWGGEFAVFMHRLSADPKYARIVQYIALSPPVDTSVGEGAAKRVENEQLFQKNYPSFKDRIAPTDFEFLNNILKHGKNSDVGGVFTGLTHMDYSTPPLSVEEQKKLKPLTVVVGTADGLVYVGREEQFQAVFGNLEAPSRLVLLGPGRTYDSNPKKPDETFLTGHGIFDLYIEGTTTPLVYSLIADVAKAEGVTPVAPADKNLATADQFFRNYANFPAFREMLVNQVEFVDTGTGSLPEIADRKKSLDDYLKLVEERKGKGKKEVEDKVFAAIVKLRETLGIQDPITLDRALEEMLFAELTDARKVELESFVAKAEAVEAKMRSDFKDPQSESEIAQLKVKFAKLMAEFNMAEITDYEPHMKAFNGKKNLDKNQERQRSELAKLHQQYAAIIKLRQGRFGAERDRLLTQIKPPQGIQDQRSALRELRADRSPERSDRLRNFAIGMKSTGGIPRDRLVAEGELLAEVENLRKPPGIASVEQAEALKIETDARLSSTYVPPQAPQLRPIAIRISELNDEIRVAFSGAENESPIPKLETAIREMRLKRNGMMKRWNSQWTRGELTSPAYTQAVQTAEHSLASYTEINEAYEATRSQWLLQLKATDRLTSAAILAQTPEVLRLRRQMQHSRRVYLADAAGIEEVKWNHEGSAALTRELKSLNDLIKADEELLEQRRQRLWLAQRQYNDLRVAYTEEMTKLNLPVPYTVEGFRMYEILNRSLSDLLQEMSTKPALVKAMQDTLSRWDDFLKEIRRDNSSRE